MFIVNHPVLTVKCETAVHLAQFHALHLSYDSHHRKLLLRQSTISGIVEPKMLECRCFQVLSQAGHWIQIYALAHEEMFPPHSW